MRVTAQSSFTAVIQGGQMLDVKPGDEFTGDVGVYLLRSGADVVAADEEAPATEEPSGTDEDEEPEDPEASEPLDISGKIEDVLAWVGDDPDRAAEARAAEEAKGDRARPRLLSKLAELEA